MGVTKLLKNIDVLFIAIQKFHKDVTQKHLFIENINEESNLPTYSDF
jgi:hypothetical protein